MSIRHILNFKTIIKELHAETAVLFLTHKIISRLILESAEVSIVLVSRCPYPLQMRIFNGGKYPVRKLNVLFFRSELFMGTGLGAGKLRHPVYRDPFILCPCYTDAST